MNEKRKTKTVDVGPGIRKTTAVDVLPPDKSGTKADYKSSKTRGEHINNLAERGRLDPLAVGGTYCRRSQKGKKPAARTSTKWCECGFKRHGPNHEQGAHHKKGKHNLGPNQQTKKFDIYSK